MCAEARVPALQNKNRINLNIVCVEEVNKNIKLFI